MAIVYITIGSYAMFIHMRPSWDKGFEDGWKSGLKCGGDHMKWYMDGWYKGWDDCVEKMDYMEHFRRGFDAGWKANGSVTDDRIKEILKEMKVK
jgi:hypothetical protein